MSEQGDRIVHAPSGSSLEIVKPATYTISSMSNFLEFENKDSLNEDNEDSKLTKDFDGYLKEKVDDQYQKYYSFLK